MCSQFGRKYPVQSINMGTLENEAKLQTQRNDEEKNVIAAKIFTFLSQFL